MSKLKEKVILFSRGKPFVKYPSLDFSDKEMRTNLRQVISY